ncbi:hypothetical protein IW148_001508 [Coemansia sp. RSA 1199]|nr:hypothetical protein IW148_001508 [Coemansia sp. RSA 1199]
MAFAYFTLMTVSALAAVTAGSEVGPGGVYAGPHAGPHMGNEGLYVPAEIIEVGYAPQTVVAAEQYAAHRDGANDAHVQFNNGQGARAGESSSPLFSTRSISSSESSEGEEDTSGLDSSTGSSLSTSIGAAAIVYALSMSFF